MGDVLALKCTAYGDPTPKITWTRVSDNSVVTFPLTISGKQDEGVYKCTADNGVGDAANRNVNVFIQSESATEVYATSAMYRSNRSQINPNARCVARGGGRRFDRYITVIFFVQKSFSNVYRLVGIYFLVCKQIKFCFLV